mmetsp:Transcript_71559/g.186521  ORF Transcript_71559/g.186521 Transcript_71559/m.186521 type:complete len:278 (+) Transcript_71559:873-1706(+)
MVAGPHRPRAPTAALHLVGDKQDVVLCAPCPKPLEVARRGHHVATLPEHGLDDKRRNLGGARLLQQQQVQRLERLFGRDARVLVGVLGPGGASRKDARARPAVRRRGGGDRQGAGRPAVVAAQERDHRVPARGLPRQAEGALDRLGTGVREEERVQARGHHRAQAIDEPVHGVAVVDGLLSVHDARRLLLHGSYHGRVAVPRRDDADAGGCVEVAPAVHRPHLRTPAAGDDELRVALHPRENPGGLGHAEAEAAAEDAGVHGEAQGGGSRPGERPDS